MAPASHSHSQQPYQYLDALLAVIPHDSIPQGIASSSRDTHANSRLYPKFIDTALRLASGGPARPDDAPPLRDAWPELQASVQRALHALHPSTSTTITTSHPAPQPPTTTKRKQSPSSSPATTSKKPKRDDADAPADDDADDDAKDDDAPQLTLHALSATAPVRHKVDITLHARTLRLAHSTTGAPVARCARTALRRAFLLPTRARSSGALQCTALLLAGDKPAPAASRGAKAKAAPAPAVRFELACWHRRILTHDGARSAPFHICICICTPPSSPLPTTSAREALHALLSSALAGTPVPLTTVERGAPLAGITAFRGVRETSLWFFDGDRTGTGTGAGAGVLASGRPAEFWALADLAAGEAGVRVRSATGRTCSVVLMRRNGADAGDAAEDEEEEEEEGEETEFQMIDGKERERILEWVRRHRGAFGRIAAEAQQGEARATAGAAADGGGGIGDSDSDSDFEMESVGSDGGSPSSDSASDAGEGVSESESGDDVEDERDRHDDNDDDDGDDEDEDEEAKVELDPKHHPLLRAGALPKMSRAAMDAAVGLVVEDLIGQGGQQRRGPPGPPVVARDEQSHEDEEGDDEEEDELDD
ncbi:hypothetical protein BC826DRAFT_1179816 [Russula brevipes]|nr:hypothetical protein BC826DRAFT_1179816 [Russula brevipes]